MVLIPAVVLEWYDDFDFPEYTAHADWLQVPPTDGSAGTVVKTFTISETQCQIVNVPLGGAITAKLTAVPKAGAPGCYVQVFQQQGCGVAIGNEYHGKFNGKLRHYSNKTLTIISGFPFDGTIVGSQVGCAQVPAVSYGAVEIICG